MNSPLSVNVVGLRTTRLASALFLATLTAGCAARAGAIRAELLDLDGRPAFPLEAAWSSGSAGQKDSAGAGSEPGAKAGGGAESRVSERRVPAGAGDDVDAQAGSGDRSGAAVNAGTGAAAIVFLFTGTECPISNRYAPEVRRLYETFRPKGVTFWLIYPDPDATPGAIREHLREYAYPMGALRDPKHALVGQTGVRVTPEAAVYVRGESGPVLAYRGRIDDRHVDFGRMRPAATSHDLERALDAILQGKPAQPRTTKAVGCFIPELR